MLKLPLGPLRLNIPCCQKQEVFPHRSGGGGGTKGPAVVDKRNVELECPHCDRTFKQVRPLFACINFLLHPSSCKLTWGLYLYLQIQRYKEHIQKKHADAADADGTPTEEASSAAPVRSQPQQQVTHTAQHKLLLCGGPLSKQ